MTNACPEAKAIDFYCKLSAAFEECKSLSEKFMEKFARDENLENL